MRPLFRLDLNGLFAALLVFLVPMLLPFARTAEVPVVIGAFVGALALPGRGASLLRNPAVRGFVLATLAYFLAALISAVDAVASEKSWTTALASVRLLLFGLGIMALCERAREHGVPARSLTRALGIAAALPIAFWTLDALVQIVTGYSLGGTLDADRLSGIFGADDLKLGPMLSTLAPLLLWPLLGRSRQLLIAAYLAVLLVILLAGSRAGWVSFTVVSLAFAWRLAEGSKKRLSLWLGAGLVVAGIGAALAYQFSPSFEVRVERTLRAGDGDADFALAGRVPIWTTAENMVRAHPLNGVGVRGFRHAYAEYASADDPWVDPTSGIGAAHAHQLVLELMTETGVIGLLLWVFGAVALLRVWRRTHAEPLARAPWVALAVLLFPLNTHLAFYSSFLGMVLGWLMALACAQSMLNPREAGDGT